MLIWPEELPTMILAEGLVDTMPDGRLFSEMETGPPKVRRRSSAAIKQVAFQFIATADHRSRVDRFWREETRGGSLPFLIRDMVNNGAALLDSDGNEITCPDGNSMLIDGNVIPSTEGGVITIAAWWLVMFGKSPPSFARKTFNAYLATISLIIMP